MSRSLLKIALQASPVEQPFDGFILISLAVAPWCDAYSDILHPLQGFTAPARAVGFLPL